MRFRLFIATFALFLILVHLNLKTPDKKTVVFVGTSFTRSIFFESMKFVHNKEELDEDEKHIPSYTIQHAPGCNLPGKAGVDLARCGPPGFRVEENNEYRFIYHFKTYLYTPWADSLMLNRINHVLGDTPADLVVQSYDVISIIFLFNYLTI